MEKSVLLTNYWVDQINDSDKRRACSKHGWNRNTFSVLFGKSEGMSPLGGLKHKWKGNIKMELKGTVWKCIESIRLMIWASERLL